MNTVKEISDHVFKHTHASVEADKYVAQQVDIVVKEIVKSIPNLRSVMLMGGYGRGEGAVAVTAKGFQLINDFDFYVICNKYVDDHTLEGVARRCCELIKKGGVAHPEGFEDRYGMDKFFHIDIRCLVINQLKNLSPIIRYYEMKHTGAVLHGEDLRSMFPDIKPEDIPWSGGIRLLMNRMLLLIMAMREEFLTGAVKMNDDERRITAYYIGKSYLSCAEALLLLKGQYRPSYAERAEYFERNFKKIASMYIVKEVPLLPEKVKFFTEYKANPEPGDMDVIKEWIKCRNDIFKVYTACIEEIFKTTLFKVPKAQAEYLKRKLDRIYFKPYADYYAKKMPLPAAAISPLINKFGRIFMAYKYCRALKDETGKVWWKPLFGNEPGVVILYLAPIILMSINEKGKGDFNELAWALNELRTIYPVDGQGSPNVNWTEVKRVWMKAYRTYYLQRFV